MRAMVRCQGGYGSSPRAPLNFEPRSLPPDARVTRNTNSDYLHRAVLPRDLVKQALAAMIDHIDYPNFKDSVEDGSLHAAYVSVWCAMAGLQHPPPQIERATHARSALASKNSQ